MKYILIVALLALTCLPASAQGRDIPACTALQVTAVSGELVEFAEKYGELTSSLPVYLDDKNYMDAVSDVDELQTEWWEEIYPELPRCAGMVEASIIFGRALDELLITVLSTQSGLNMLASDDLKMDGAAVVLIAQEHLETWTNINREVGSSASRILPED